MSIGEPYTAGGNPTPSHQSVLVALEVRKHVPFSVPPLLEYKFLLRWINSIGGVGVLVYYKNIPIVKCKYGISFSSVPGLPRVCLDYFQIVLKHRRRGHGTRILRHLIQWYRQSDTQVIYIPAPTPIGVSFYRSLGFRRTDWGDYQFTL